MEVSKKKVSKRFYKAMAVALSIALGISLIMASSSADTAGRMPILSAKRKTLYYNRAGENTYTLKVKKNKTKLIKSTSWKTSNKNVVSISGKKKTSVKLTAKKAGEAKIVATVKYTLKGSKKVKKKKLNCTVTVKKYQSAATVPTTDVTTSAPTPATQESRSIASEPLRSIVFSLVSSAENSSVDYMEQYAYIEDIGDGRGYTGGIIGFTSGTGDMLDVINEYMRLKPENNMLEAYIPALESVNGTDSHEGLGIEFEQAWEKAAEDALFIDAQNAILNKMYMNPAAGCAENDGLSPLGAYIYYDALVVHGPGESEDSFGGIRSAAMEICKTPAQGGDEEEYLSAFLDARTVIMLQEEAHSDLSRLDVQRKFMSEENYSLSLPLKWTMYGDEFELSE